MAPDLTNRFKCPDCDYVTPHEIDLQNHEQLHDGARLLPTRERGNRLFLAMLEYIADVHRKKAAGYSGTDNEDTWANFREAESWGLTPSQGCRVRLGDKYRRYQNITRDPGNEQLGETIFDTGTDGANYWIIDLCLAYEEGQFELPDHPAFKEFK